MIKDVSVIEIIYGVMLPLKRENLSRCFAKSIRFCKTVPLDFDCRQYSM